MLFKGALKGYHHSTVRPFIQKTTVMQRRRRIKTVIAVAFLIAAKLFCLSPENVAQSQIPAPEYDYYFLAINSISNSANEATKLPKISQRVSLLLRAAKILPASQHDEAIRLLEVALRNLKEWGSKDKASWYQRHTAAELRNEVLAIYTKLDPERATARQKEFQAAVESTPIANEAASRKDGNWFTQFSDRRTIADQAAKIAASLVDPDPDRALGLVVQSLQGGTVSSVLFGIVQREIQDGNRAFLNRLEIAIGQVLASNVTLDPFSIAYASSLVQSDKEMQPSVRAAFVSFFLRSLQAWSGLISGPSEGAGFVIDTDYISNMFTMFSLNARPIILQYSPEQLLAFDLALNQMAPLVPEKTKSRLQAFQPEKFSDPRDRLNDILKDPNPERRDLRLVGLVSQLLRSESEEFQKNFDLAADATSGFSDADTKSAFTDLLTITRINVFVKEKKFIEAQRLAGSISSKETRAWALLALSTVAAKADPILGFELISNALKALDAASPSPHKVQLALAAAAMLAKNDPQRAFDTLSVASRYANSSAAKVDPPAKPPVAFGLDASIGEAHTKLGVFPESLAELQIDPSLSVLGTADWFRANEIADNIREPALRLQLKLQFAEAMLVQESKPKKKETTPKPSVKNSTQTISPPQ